MKKNQITILIVIAIVVLVGLIAWSLVRTPEISFEEEVVEVEEEEELAPVFSLSGTVSSVDAANNFITVKPVNREEVKVLIAETTRLIKLEFPFDPASPPADGTFTPTQTEIEISDFEPGDTVFIKVKDDIAGKTEFGNVDFIHILP